jgi:mono/diheme cytochrome c family protein
MNRDHDYGGTTANQLRTLEYLQLLSVNSTGDFHARIRNKIVAAEREKHGDTKLDAAAQKEFDKVVNDLFHTQTATRDQRSAPAAQSLLFDDPSTLPTMPNPYDEAAPLGERARSYLHSNCAHCHVPAGGGNSKLDLAWTTPLEGTHIWNERPSHHTFDLKNARLIAPGHPKRSVLLQRVRMRGPGQMPQLATSEIDQQAVDLLRRWIKSTKN